MASPAAVALKILALVVFKHDDSRPILLEQHEDLSSFPFYHRSTLREYILFQARLFASRTPRGTRQSVDLSEYKSLCHIFVHARGVAVVAFTNMEYPVRVAQSVLYDAARSFLEASRDAWTRVTEDVTSHSAKTEAITQLFTYYQKPEENDKIMKIERELGEVKNTVVKSMDELLQRGETLEALMQKSSDLSNTSYQFYRTAKKNNQCCSMY